MTGVEHLDTMDNAALKAAWIDEFGRPPPVRASDGYMRSVLAYRIQEEAGQNLSARSRRQLEKLVSAFERDPNLRPATTTGIKEGTKLLREWNGVTHEVTALTKGFEYQGMRHRSLSAIAREITGTRWSGPAFFGLKAQTNA